MRLASIIAVTMTVASAAAADVSLSLGFDAEDLTVSTANYECGEQEGFTVQYLNSESNMLALVPVEGAQRVFVNVISGSGARYVSGRYEWWTKGDESTLSDVTTEEPHLQCTANSR